MLYNYMYVNLMENKYKGREGGAERGESMPKEGKKTVWQSPKQALKSCVHVYSTKLFSPLTCL